MENEFDFINDENNSQDTENSTSVEATETSCDDNIVQDEASWHEESHGFTNNTVENSNTKHTRTKKAAAVSWTGLVACMLVMMLVGGAIGGLCVWTLGKNADKSAVNATQAPLNTSIPSKGINYTDKNADRDSSDAAKLVNECTQSVVSINVTIVTTSTNYFGQRQESTSEGAGSGVILTANGYIATCYHVIEGATTIKVSLQDGKSYDATVKGYDSRTDLAVIKIEATGLHAATIGNSDNYAVGDAVYAIGNPLGEYTSSVSKGIISGIDRSVEIDGQSMTLMQTDAAVNPGNSGGALFSAVTGELIGIVNAKSYGVEIDGLGFAIPMSTAQSIVTDIMDLGYVTGRPYLGISMQTVTVSQDNGAQSIFGNLFGGNATYAVLVVGVTENSPAANAGIQTGDYLTKLNDTELTDTASFKTALNDFNAGDIITLTVKRNGQIMEIKVTLGESSACN